MSVTTAMIVTHYRHVSILKGRTLANALTDTSQTVKEAVRTLTNAPKELLVTDLRTHTVITLCPDSSASATPDISILEMAPPDVSILTNVNKRISMGAKLIIKKRALIP
jgi:hypothetical protein